MKRCLFNFNNEVDTIDIDVDEETGRVTVPGDNGPMAEYANVKQLAEIYAQARNVKPENLKNWTLLENGNVYSYVLKAGTAGATVSEVEEELENVFQSLEGSHHPLSIARAKEQIMGDGTADITDALVHCNETDVARDVYDAMQRQFENNENEEVAEDTRSELEKFIDDLEDTPGALNLIAFIVYDTVPENVDKETLVADCQNNRILSNPDTLCAIYSNLINEAMENGIGVNTRADAITVITQTPVGETDENAKNRLAYTVRAAGRSKVNISVDIVGTSHIRHTAELVELNELDDANVFVRDNVPYIIRFSDIIDAELEAEHDAEEADRVTQQTEDGYDGYNEDDEYDEE